MQLSDLFVARHRQYPVVTPESAAAPAAADDAFAGTPKQEAAPAPAWPALPGGAVGAFITPQSFVSFPVASGLVTLAWAVMRQLFPWGASTMVPAVAALLVGGTIFLYNVSDPASAPKTRPGWIVAVVIAVFNTLFLLSAALGIYPKS